MFSKSQRCILDCGVLLIFIEIAEVLLMENSINDLNELASLYDEFFIMEEANKNPPKEKEKIKNPLTFLGGYKSGFLMLYNSPGGIAEKDREMVHNLVVNAIKISWDEVGFLNLAENSDYSLSEIFAELSPQKVLSWGVSLTVLGWNGIDYQVQSFGQSQILTVTAIADFHDNRDLKLKLWAGIQELLGLK